MSKELIDRLHKMQREPVAWGFIDDPSVFCPPGAGIAWGKEPPPFSINHFPLYAKSGIID